MKRYDLVEAIAVSGVVIFFMLLLALNEVYPMAYFWPVLLILLWPAMLLIKSRVKNTFCLSIAVWLVASIVLFAINYLFFRRYNGFIWWCVYPIIGISFWPLCELFRLFMRRGEANDT